MYNYNKILAVMIAITMMCFWYVVANAENDILYVCVDEGSFLNGRSGPSKKADVTMRLYSGDKVEVVDIVDGWVEIIGGESGTSFVDSHYVSETKEPYKMINTSGGRVRVRDSIDGNAVGYVKAKGVVTIERTILGWGYTGHGWVMLSYFDTCDDSNR
jgi:uncharacterized protein YgiM (DUF1202 family)